MVLVWERCVQVAISLLNIAEIPIADSIIIFVKVKKAF